MANASIFFSLVMFECFKLKMLVHASFFIQYLHECQNVCKLNSGSCELATLNVNTSFQLTLNYILKNK